MRRIFLDTEFKNLPWTGHSELLWVGLADESGSSWSAINADVVVDEHASEFTQQVVVPRMSPDEPRLSTRELRAAIVDFCGEPDEIWAWCPTVEVLRDAFGLGSEAQRAHEAYWDWDLRLLRGIVEPWSPNWPTNLSDLNAAARAVGVVPPSNRSAHHPRDDALWNLEVFRLLESGHRG